MAHLVPDGNLMTWTVKPNDRESCTHTTLPALPSLSKSCEAEVSLPEEPSTNSDGMQTTLDREENSRLPFTKTQSDRCERSSGLHTRAFNFTRLTPLPCKKSDRNSLAGSASKNDSESHCDQAEIDLLSCPKSLLTLAEARRLHIVTFSEGTLRHRGTAMEDAVVVVVVVQLEEAALSSEHFPQLIRMGPSSSVPVITILVRGRKSAGRDEILRARRLLLASRVDDVILEPRQGGLEAVTVQLRLSLARVLDCRSNRAQTCKAIQNEHHQRKTALKEALNKQLERTNLLFFSLAHHAWKDLPRLMPRVSINPREGLSFEDHTLDKLLSRTRRASAFRSVRTNGRVEVLKFFAKDQIRSLKDMDRIAREVRILKSLDHPGVVRLLGLFHFKHNYVLRMEYAGLKSLYNIIERSQKLPEGRANSLAKNLTTAIEYCHDMLVAIRDVKPEKLSVNQKDELKLSNFESAETFQPGGTFRGCAGIMPFIAPEVLSGRTYHPSKADLWSCGVVYFEMLSGNGSFSKVLGWPNDLEAEPERAVELSCLLGSRENMSQVFERYGFSPTTLDTLAKMLHVDPEFRTGYQCFG